MRFLNLVLMSFICEKLHSTEAVATGIDKHTFDRALRFGNMVTSMSFLANSLSWAFMSSSGFFERKQRKVFYSVCTSDVISGGFINSSPCTVWAGFSAP